VAFEPLQAAVVNEPKTKIYLTEQKKNLKSTKEAEKNVLS
jgi:hypothetical protein